MRITFLAPQTGVYTENKNWLWWVADELKKYHEVHFNKYTDNTDLIICMSDSMTPALKELHEKYPDKPIITYIWDWFSFVDTTKGNYPDYLELMKKSREVWTSTDYMVKRIKKLHGIDCHKIKPCSVLEEIERKKTQDLGYVVQASRRDERYKRFEFFERNCNELGIPYKSCHPSKYKREDYINILAGCSILVVATCEDANTALSAIEAAYLKKPVLLSDIEPHKEEFGDIAEFFKTDDPKDFQAKLKELYEQRNEPWVRNMTQRAYEKVMASYTPQTMAKAMANRLHVQ